MKTKSIKFMLLSLMICNIASCDSKLDYKYRAVFFNTQTFKIANIDSAFNDAVIDSSMDYKYLVKIIFYGNSDILFYSPIVGVKHFNEIVIDTKGSKETIFHSKGDQKFSWITFAKVANNLLYYMYSDDKSKINIYDLENRHDNGYLSVNLGEVVNLWTANSTPDAFVFNSREKNVIKSGLLTNHDNKSDVSYFDFKLSDYNSKSGNVLATDADGNLFFSESLHGNRLKVDLSKNNADYAFYSAHFVDNRTAVICMRKTTNDIISNFLFSVTNEYKKYYYKYYLVTIGNDAVKTIKPFAFLSDDYQLVDIY